MVRVAAIVQARTKSTRFPGKVLKEISKGRTVIQLIFERLSYAKNVDKVIFAIPEGIDDDILAHHLESIGAETFRGSLGDVQLRYIECALATNSQWIVRITGDCPLVDPSMVDEMIKECLEGNFDYFSNLSPPTMPDGLDVEVFKLSALLASREIESTSKSKEHVTVHLRESSLFRTGSISHIENFSHERWTVDYPDDLIQIKEKLPLGFETMGWLDLKKRGFTGVQNSKAIRNEGYEMSEGQKLWNRAKTLIPGGGMLLSKRPEMFLPSGWPTYYAKAKGINVFDLEGTKYIDFSTMSVGACTLGYGNDAVDEAVMESVKDGVMSSLNSPGDVRLAERLVELHPWAQMARFARSGGEANAIAVRIARAHTRRDKIAVCGYHGWHDWYLAANLNSETELDGHLLPGLEPAGVPRGLLGTTNTFSYNDAAGLERLLSTKEYAAVKMEVARNLAPNSDVLEQVRSLCDKYGSLLIFDECTSGFRESFGGLHLKFGVEPDMAMFGKALGNGFAITAVLGKESVMQSAQKTFISSTFWTERIGPMAALATLSEMNRLRSWEVLPRLGRQVKEFWSRELSKLGLEASIYGLDPIPTFSINVPHWQIIKTLFTQEMLKRGYLASSSIYLSVLHEGDELAGYFEAFVDTMRFIANNFDESQAMKLLQGPIAHSGFTRLN